jgi:hypothetical protein
VDSVLLDNALSVVLLDIPQVFQVQFSRSCRTDRVSLATVVLRLLVAAGARG